jgi:iron complex outermembrane receptor protein
VSRSKAGFAQLTYDIQSNLHLTGGVRYTNDFKSRNGSTVLYFPNQASVPSSFGSQCVGTTCTLNQNIASATFEKVTWKVGLDYDVPGLGLAYFNVSTGYKAGGFNDGCVTGSGLGCALSASTLYYRPEQLTAYEGGVKFKFADGKVRFNASAFHYDYSNLQLSQAATLTDPTTGAKRAADVDPERRHRQDRRYRNRNHVEADAGRHVHDRGQLYQRALFQLLAHELVGPEREFRWQAVGPRPQVDGDGGLYPQL